MKKIVFISFLFFLAGCRSPEVYDFQNHPFDPQVLQKLPLYDSLAQVLIQNFTLLRPEIDEKNAFTFDSSSGPALLNRKLPRSAVDQFNGFVVRLGKNFFSGFAVYRDSTIRFSLRDTYLEHYDVKIMERLSYFPKGAKTKESELPNKDTIVGKKWRYWIRFDERKLF